MGQAETAEGEKGAAGAQMQGKGDADDVDAETKKLRSGLSSTYSLVY